MTICDQKNNPRYWNIRYWHFIKMENYPGRRAKMNWIQLASCFPLSNITFHHTWTHSRLLGFHPSPQFGQERLSQETALQGPGGREASDKASSGQWWYCFIHMPHDSFRFRSWPQTSILWPVGIDKSCFGGRGHGNGLKNNTESPNPGVFYPCFPGRCRLRCISCWGSLCVLWWLYQQQWQLKSLISVPDPPPSHFCSHSVLI